MLFKMHGLGLGRVEKAVLSDRFWSKLVKNRLNWHKF